MPMIQHSVEALKIIYDKVCADSRFTLYYLRAVDAAIDVATDVRNDAQTTERAIKQYLARLDRFDGYKNPIDPDGKLTSVSAGAEAAVKKTICALQEHGEEWKTSRIFKEHDKEMFERIEEAIGALQKLHDEMVELRWVVIEHDADLEEPKGRVFENVEDLFADLRSR